MGAQKTNIPQLGIFLGVLSALAAGLLSVVSISTADAIKANQQKKTNAALKQVLPQFDNVPGDETVVIDSAEGWPVKFYIARNGGTVVGYAGEVVTPKGFSGDVTLMAGLALDGAIRTVIVTANTETPGLGTAITDRKRKKTLVGMLKGGVVDAGLPPNQYLDQYATRIAGAVQWNVVKDGGDVDAKTGATITSRAVCGAVYAIAKTCTDHLAELSTGAKQ